MNDKIIEKLVVDRNFQKSLTDVFHYITFLRVYLHKLKKPARLTLSNLGTENLDNSSKNEETIIN
jgi:hypothetical protein